MGGDKDAVVDVADAGEEVSGMVTTGGGSRSHQEEEPSSSESSSSMAGEELILAGQTYVCPS